MDRVSGDLAEVGENKVALTLRVRSPEGQHETDAGILNGTKSLGPDGAKLRQAKCIRLK